MSSFTKNLCNIKIVIFRYDIRLIDNPTLNAACIKDQVMRSSPSVKNNDNSFLIPLYIFDSRFLSNKTIYNNKKTCLQRVNFIKQSVIDLKFNLMKLNSNLVIEYGLSENVLVDLIQKMKLNYNINKIDIFIQRECCLEENVINMNIKKAFIKNKITKFELHQVWGGTLYELSELPFDFSNDKDNIISNIPNIPTQFRVKCEKEITIPEIIPIPDINVFNTLSFPYDVLLTDDKDITNINIDEFDFNKYIPTYEMMGYDANEIESLKSIDNRSAISFLRGGETYGLKRINDYIFQNHRILEYFNTRNELIGSEYSSKFSPYLAFGCISPRYIAKEISRYEKDNNISTKSTYWIIFELCVRDFCKFYSLKYGDKIFHKYGIMNKSEIIKRNMIQHWKYDAIKFNAWINGQTGIPFIDANMRELKLTNFMSNRGRQNVASYLIFDLNIDWRYGADYFESILIDYDIYSNYVSWQMAAGITGNRVNKFNAIKQAKDYDSNGEYIKLWCPELKDVPKKFIFEPYNMNEKEMKQYNCILDHNYPKPIVDIVSTVYTVKKSNNNNNNNNEKSNKSISNTAEKPWMQKAKKGSFKIGNNKTDKFDKVL